MTPSFVELPNIILQSHETNDQHSSKVASVCLPEAPISSSKVPPEYVCVCVCARVRLMPPKKFVIPPEIPRKVCHAILSVFSQLSLYLSNRIHDFQRQITAAPRREEGKYCRPSTSLIRSILGLIINHYSFWIYSRGGGKGLDHSTYQSLRTQATDNPDQK